MLGKAQGGQRMAPSSRRSPVPRIQPGPRRVLPIAEEDAPTGVWEARLRLWIAVNGHNALGPGKIRLLETIAAYKSLSAAAKYLRMSYRLAWKHLRLIEKWTGVAVVEPHRGGPSGGGTDLTPQGKALLEAYHNLRSEVEQHIQSACYRHFAPWSSSATEDDTSTDSGPDQESC
jgi:molybdate transport system regulatory protein